VARRKRRAEGAPEPGRLTPAGLGRFELSGEVGFDDAARLLAEGDAAFDHHPATEIDLARVARADSAGLALLLEWSLAAASAGRELRYRNVPRAIASLAGISDVAELLAPGAGG
jgi:phospholipid transport system transporter-binding protein